MDSSQKQSCVTSVVKLFVMVILAGGVVLTAFWAGMRFEARQTPARVAIESENPAQILPSIPPTSGSSAPATTNADGFDVFWEAWDIVQNEFYKDVPNERERVYGAIRGMVNTYGDEHTAFIDPTRAGILQEDSTGAFEGIGAAVRTDELGRLIIAEPFIGRPAAEAGVLRGDVVLEVDGQSLRGLSLYESVQLIRGPAGTVVTLTILREGEPDPLHIDVTRARIEIEVVESDMLDGNIGYVKLSEFSSGASDKLHEAIQQLEADGATTLILDLRNNPGGFLSESVAVSSLFIDKGVVVREQRKGAVDEQVYEARSPYKATKLPLVVLLNRGSASASEIVAGAVKDHERGTLIGEQSFGKGTVQLPHTLSDGSELRVTIAQWFTPDGNLIHKEGIVPDVVVERTQEDFFDGLDPQLDRAVEFLQQGK